MSESAEINRQNNPELNSRRERLFHVLQQPEIISLSNDRTSPLTLTQLRVEIPRRYRELAGVEGDDSRPGDADFFDCEEVFGWPDETDVVRGTDQFTVRGDDGREAEIPGFEHGPREYSSLEDFTGHMEYDADHFDYPEKGLNNFLVPFTSHEEYNFGDDLRGRNLNHVAQVTEPHFMRLKVIAPEFVEVLRASVQDHLQERTRITGDPVLMDGLYRAYKIMGRLVSKHDVQRHGRFLGFEGKVGEPIEDVHHALVS